jgi:hypothetical protein
MFEFTRVSKSEVMFSFASIKFGREYLFLLSQIYFLHLQFYEDLRKADSWETEIQMLCETLLLLLKIVRNIIPNLRGFYRMILVNLNRVTSYYTCKPTGPINILHHAAVDLCFVELKVHTHDISDPNFYILAG